MRSLAISTALAGALLLGAASAEAKHLCVYKSNGSILFTAHRFKLPKPGACNAVHGNSGNAAMHGTVCRTVSGNVLRLGIAVEAQAPLFGSPQVRHLAVGLDHPFGDGPGSGAGTELKIEPGAISGVVEDFYQLNDLTADYCTAGGIS